MAVPHPHADAWERYGKLRPGGLLYTCEHASNRVPRPWRPRPADRRLLQTHWGYDIGAAHLTRDLAKLGDGCAVLARFSRLLIDPNRAPEEPSAVLRSTDDGDPTFNRAVDLDARVARFHAPFHAAVADAIARERPRRILSIHTFTPELRGVRRTVEAGVLYDREDPFHDRLVDALRAEGFVAEPNQPYSGFAGLIYSAARHGAEAGIPYLEIELRQDLVAAERHARVQARRIHRALVRAGL